MVTPEITKAINDAVASSPNQGYIPYHIHNGIDSPKLNSQSSNGDSVFSWSTAQFGASSTTYLGLGVSSSTESDVSTPWPASGTISVLYIKVATAQDASGSLVLTFRKNAADTAMTVTVPAGAAARSTVSDLAHSFTVTAGDLLDIKAVNNASATSAFLQSVVFKFTSN